MDLLLKRYASPFFFIDEAIKTGRFSEFVSFFFNTVHKEREEETSWEYFLHKVFEGSYADFKEDMRITSENQNMTDLDFETTINHSMNILKNFNPEKG